MKPIKLLFILMLTQWLHAPAWAQGVAGLSGTYILENRNSRMAMDVAEGGNPGNGTNILQWHMTGNPNQQFKFSEVSPGVYSIICVATGKSLDVDALSQDNFANILQWEYLNGDNQHFRVEVAGGGFYKLRAMHSGKIIEVFDASRAAGGNISQFEDNGQACGQWNLIPVGVGNNSWSRQVEAESFTATSGVNREACTEGGENVVNISTGAWMAYSGINIPAAGDYVLEYRVASAVGGGVLSTDLNAGATVLGSIDIPNTGGGQNWTTVTKNVHLEAGMFSFGLFAQTGGFNINWFSIKKEGDGAGKLPSVRVFLMGGQSNMVGWNGGAPELPEALKRNQTVDIKVFGHTNTGWIPVRPGLGRDADSFGPELTFAYDMQRYFPGEKIAIIKGAWPATNLFNQWRSPSSGRSGGQGDLYDIYVRQVRAALDELRTKYENVSVEGMCWMQGEDDSNNYDFSVNYEFNLGNLVKDFRNDFAVPAMPFVIAKIDASASWENHVIVRQAEENVAKSMSNVYVFETHGYPTDSWHYFKDGYVRMGADFARVMSSHLCPTVTEGIAVFYQDCNYGGYERFLGPGSYNSGQLTAAGIGINEISALKVQNGYKVTLFSEDNFQGSSVEITEESICLLNFNDQAQSLIISPNGVSGLSGIYRIKNRFSNLYMELWEGNTALGAKYVQWPFTGNNNQVFRLEEVESGTYKITNLTSGLSLDVANLERRNGIQLIQYSYLNHDNQKFIIKEAKDGYYNLITKNSGLAIEVSWEDYTHGANVVQRGNGYDNSGQWQLEFVRASALKRDLNESLLATEELKLYPNPAQNQLTISGVKDNTAITVYEITGKAVLESKLFHHSINIRDLNPGLYIVKVEGEEKILKFIKE